jgi:glycogen phosphorylase
MSEHARTSSSIHSLPPAETDGFESLAALALNLRWAWNHRTDSVWKQLDPVLWELTRNPWTVMQTVSREKLRALLGNAAFRKQLDSLIKADRRSAESPAWFQNTHPQAELTCAAYFSMEFMLSEALPIYSGGLGNVAGDQLKAASDLGVPVIGVGLLYQQGYFRQLIDRDGAQQALYPYNDPGQLPITPVRQPSGEWLHLDIALPGHSVRVRVWQVQVGRVKLYLLDSNDAANFPVDRAITSELYGGGAELRLKQELILGIGGWQVLAAQGLKPQVCHLNEGHAAFAILERARHFMAESGQPFEVALAVTRAGNLFTTHTAVAAGFDRFPPALIEQYLGTYATESLGISVDDLLALGRQNREDPSEHFNTAYLAVRGSGAVNAVSRLHGDVSRHLFAPLFPRWPAVEVPVGHVTNGVHMPTWDSAAADEIWTNACGKDRWLGTTETLRQDIRRVSDERLWEMRAAGRQSLVEYARQRLVRQLAASSRSADMVEFARHVFDPQALTLGFARRFATYKRPNLLLHDPARLLRLLTNPQRPVQLIVAGKAHPADRAGQALIQEWMRFIWRPEARAHVIFLADHDMLLAERLVQGVDVWINTPERPWEACGTSGMKVLVNGGINLSELDGWWAEAYAPDLGWALGDGEEHHGDPAWDAAEAEMLYDRLEHDVIPEFYSRDTNGVPTAWVSRMRESMARLTPQFCTSRTLRDYTEQHYMPAARRYLERSIDNGALGVRIVEWQRALAQNWAAVRFGEFEAKSDGSQHLFELEVYLRDLDPNAVQIELYADGLDDSGPVRQEMKRVRELKDVPGGFVYATRVPATRPAAHYTPRMIGAYGDDITVPLEAPWIDWQR